MVSYTELSGRWPPYPKWSIILGSYSILLIMNILHNIYVSFSALSSAINMELKEHKEAALDISQQLSPDHYSWGKGIVIQATWCGI